MHFLHSTIAARRSFTCCTTLQHALVPRFSSTSSAARPKPQVHGPPNEHLLTFLRAHLKEQDRIVSTRKEAEMAWLAKWYKPDLSKTAQLSDTYWKAVREQKALEWGIEVVERHRAPIRSIQQAKRVVGMTEEMIPRIERILKGEEVMPKLEQSKVHLTSLVSPLKSVEPHGNGATRLQVKALAIRVKDALHKAGRRCLVSLAGAHRRGASHSHKVVLCIQLEPIHALASAATRQEAAQAAEEALRLIREALGPLLEQLKLKPEEAQASHGEEQYILEHGAVVSIELHVTAKISRGSSLVVLTGPEEYVRSLQELAKHKLGVDMDEHGLWSLPSISHDESAAAGVSDEGIATPSDGHGQATQQLRRLPSPDEGTLYNILELPFVLPKARFGSVVKIESPESPLQNSNSPPSANDHIIPLLRQRIAVIQLAVARRQERKKRLAAEDPERKTPSSGRVTDQINALRIATLESSIAALRAHPERVETVIQARTIDGIAPNVLPRIERILKGEKSAPSLGHDPSVSESLCLRYGLEPAQARHLASKFEALLPEGLTLHVLGDYRRGAARIDKLVFCVCLPRQSADRPVPLSDLSGDGYGLNKAWSSKQAKARANGTLRLLRSSTYSFFREMRTKHKRLKAKSGVEVYQLCDGGEVFTFELHVTAPNSLGASLLVLTGDDEYVRSLQDIAKSKLATLDAFGIWRGTTTSDSIDALAAEAATKGPIIKADRAHRLTATRAEDMVYSFLGVAPVDPQERTLADIGKKDEKTDI